MNNTIGSNPLPLLFPALTCRCNCSPASPTAATAPSASASGQNVAQALELFMAQLLATLADYLAVSITTPQGSGKTPSGSIPASQPKSPGSRRAQGGPTGAKLGGFLWKPSSDSNGNLVILLPPALSQQPSQVSVASPGGRTIAAGKMGGIGNGNRRHFRFDRPGRSFPPGSTVIIKLQGGVTKTVKIENTSERQELRHIK